MKHPIICYGKIIQDVLKNINQRKFSLLNKTFKCMRRPTSGPQVFVNTLTVPVFDYI